MPLVDAIAGQVGAQNDHRLAGQRREQSVKGVPWPAKIGAAE